MNEIFELPAPKLKALLADVVTPALPGFTHNGAYIWYSSWENHCRKVVKIYPLKGASYIFQWGLCFDFPPALYEKLQKKLLACANGGDIINNGNGLY